MVKDKTGENIGMWGTEFTERKKNGTDESLAHVWQNFGLKVNPGKVMEN